MKDINIAARLVDKRKEKGITQDDLAAYIGVSKASVSKWETGQSYPDITFLPQLATYFGISIDELMGYSPQLEKEDIAKLYKRLAAAFATQPFEEVLNECRTIIKKYYSCFPLLLQMAILLMNHHMLSPDSNEQKEILEEATKLCVRVKTESDDVWLSKDAVSMEATCLLMSQRPQDLLNLVGERIRPISADSEMIARAYHLLGNIDKAKQVTQVNIYQHLIALIGDAPFYLLLNADNLEKAEEIINRAVSLADIYHLERLHPNTMAQFYYAAAQVFCMNNCTRKALDMLQNYTDLCTNGFFPLTLHGDSYFDMIENWFHEIEMGEIVPRNEKTIKESMLQGVLSNPAFACLTKEAQFNSMINKLKVNCDMNTEHHV